MFVCVFVVQDEGFFSILVRRFLSLLRRRLRSPIEVSIGVGRLGGRRRGVGVAVTTQTRKHGFSHGLEGYQCDP